MTADERLCRNAKWTLGFPIGSPQYCYMRNSLRHEAAFGTISKHWYVGSQINSKSECVEVVYWFPKNVKGVKERVVAL